MKTYTFDVYMDPGHGWLKTTLDFVDKLGVRERITPYSYVRKNNVYLEEDCDVSIFLAELIKKGFDYRFRQHYSNKLSKIRSYQSYPYYSKDNTYV